MSIRSFSTGVPEKDVAGLLINIFGDFDLRYKTRQEGNSTHLIVIFHVVSYIPLVGDVVLVAGCC